MKLMKIMNTKLTTTLSFGLMGLAAGALLTGCASMPKENAGAKVMHFENTHAGGVRLARKRARSPAVPAQTLRKNLESAQLVLL